MNNPGRIMVVDDDHQVRTAFLRVFQRAGYETAGADSAEEAIKLVHEDSFDLVVTDIVMGGMDGIELLERIRKERATLPVVLVTAYSKEEYEERARCEGAYAYVRKPVSRRQLLSIAREAIAARQSCCASEEGAGIS